MIKLQSWDDLWLLEEEPFHTEFMVRNLKDFPRGRSATKDNWYSRIGQEILDARGPGIVQAWLDKVFAPSNPGEPEIKRKVDDDTLRFFVDFYWLCYQKPEIPIEAMTLVNKERGKFGLYSLPKRQLRDPPKTSKTSAKAASNSKAGTMSHKNGETQPHIPCKSTPPSATTGRPTRSVLKNLRFNKTRKLGQDNSEEFTQPAPEGKGDATDGVGSRAQDNTASRSLQQKPPNSDRGRGECKLKVEQVESLPDKTQERKSRKRASDTNDGVCSKRRALESSSTGSLMAEMGRPKHVVRSSTTDLADQLTLSTVSSSKSICHVPISSTKVASATGNGCLAPDLQSSRPRKRKGDASVSGPTKRARRERNGATTDHVPPDTVHHSTIESSASQPAAPINAPRFPKKTRSHQSKPAPIMQLKHQQGVDGSSFTSQPRQVQARKTEIPRRPDQGDSTTNNSIPFPPSTQLTRPKLEEPNNLIQHMTQVFLPSCQTPQPLVYFSLNPSSAGGADPIKQVDWIDAKALEDDTGFSLNPDSGLCLVDSYDTSANKLPRNYRPPLPMYPPIWAQSRQEVCESFDWFRSYQGGVYFADGITKGYLLSAFASKRDRFEHGGRLIISHGGGKAESIHCSNGQSSTHAASDQLAQDKSVRSLLKNYETGRPLALVIDDKYVLFPYDLGVKDITYAILGFYTISNVWTEYQQANTESGRVVRYKFAFRWCEDQGPPWWISEDDQNSRLESESVVSLKNPTSHQLRRPSTPELFDQCTPCASPSESFAQNTFAYSNDKLDKSVEGTPREQCLVKIPEHFEPISRTCSQCQTSSPQVYTPWVCLQSDCVKFWRNAQDRLLPDQLEFYPGFLTLPPSKCIPPGFGQLKPTRLLPKPSDGVVTSYAFTRGWHCNNCGRLSCRYQWEQWECMHCGAVIKIEGAIHNAKDFWAKDLIPGGRDFHIEASSQIKALPVANYKHERGLGIVQSFILPKGRGVIHHIQPGTPFGRLEADEIFRRYQEQAADGTLKFRRWPLRAHKCRGPLLTHYFSQNSGEPYQYVGGTANTVPLSEAPGAVVDAKDLIQRRIYQALGQSAEFNEILSAGYMEKQKMAFHSDNEIGLGPLVAGLSLGSPALMHFRLHPKYDPDRTHRGIAASFVLRHGDVLVMDGAGVQEYYEHTVVPNNFRIAATARQITPRHRA